MLFVIQVLLGCLLFLFFQVCYGISDLFWSVSSLSSSGVPPAVCIPWHLWEWKNQFKDACLPCTHCGTWYHAVNCSGVQNNIYTINKNISGLIWLGVKCEVQGKKKIRKWDLTELRIPLSSRKITKPKERLLLIRTPWRSNQMQTMNKRKINWSRSVRVLKRNRTRYLSSKKKSRGIECIVVEITEYQMQQSETDNEKSTGATGEKTLRMRRGKQN